MDRDKKLILVSGTLFTVYMIWRWRSRPQTIWWKSISMLRKWVAFFSLESVFYVRLLLVIQYKADKIQYCSGEKRHAIG